MNSQISDEENKIVVTKSNTIKLISDVMENKFSEKMITLEIEGNHSSVQNVNYASHINETIKGIPSNLDLEKRQSAQRIISFDKDFNIVFFVMPNGDMYIQEPYSAQINNKVLNFAFRDWYRGAIANHDTYISEAYLSQATDRKAVAISEPIYFNNGTLKGLWVGLINLDSLKQEISKLDFSHDRRIIIVDHKDHSIIDTGIVNDNKNFAMYTGLNSVTSALDGKSGSVIEMINGTKMFSIYEPLKIGSHVWAAVLTQPYDDVFGIISSAKELSIMTSIVTILIMAITGFFVYKTTHANEILTRKLREDDIKKEEFSAMITHELKTPLVPIIGYCKMFKTSMLGKLSQEQSEAIEIIEKNTKRLESLITDIMDVRKLDLGKLKFKIDNLPLDEFFSDLDSDYRQVFGNKRCKFTTSLYDKNLVIKTDRARLRQAFDNLINNAIKFVPESDGKIDVGCIKENGNLVFYVKDNGPGIPPEKQKQLFQKFYQIDTSDSRPIGGTGLGLAISKGIVEKLDGTISVESDGRTGTTFYMKFPLES